MKSKSYIAKVCCTEINKLFNHYQDPLTDAMSDVTGVMMAEMVISEENLAKSCEEQVTSTANIADSCKH